MQRQKAKPIADLSELRYKMCEKMAAFEDGEISSVEAKTYIGFGTVIVNSCKVEMVRDQAMGVVRSIDFIDGNKDVPTLKSEFFEHDKKLATI